MVSPLLMKDEQIRALNYKISLLQKGANDGDDLQKLKAKDQQPKDQLFMLICREDDAVKAITGQRQILSPGERYNSVVQKGITHGAVDYLIKPVRMEALKNIWQHVVRKKRCEWSVPEHCIEENGDRRQQQHRGAVSGGDDVVDDNSSSVNEGNNWRSSSRKRKVEEGEEQGDDKEEDASNLKKPRVVWSVELHQQFVAAVNKLGVEKAVPKKILELMNVPGLTRENVASHLEKYRIYPRRLGGISQHQGSLKNSFMTGQDASFGPLSTLNGFDLQALAVTGQLPAQNLNLMVRFSNSLGQIQQFDSGIKDLDVEIFKFLTG